MMLLHRLDRKIGKMSESMQLGSAAGASSFHGHIIARHGAGNDHGLSMFWQDDARSRDQSSA